MNREHLFQYTIPMLQEWVWGATPSGFRRLHRDEAQMIVVREGLDSHWLQENFSGQSDSQTEASPFYGRGRLRFLHLGDGERALVRAYRHGGIFRGVTGELFFTWPPRPFGELAITEEARRRGIPTLEVLAACAQRIWGPFYRGWLITRELKDADDLWAALESERYAGAAREPLLKSVAGSIQRMHRKGFVHRDLNLKNILVRAE
ncbi:MAG: lipopolysaccharide kinase InaA family protein, partial [Candidatus Binatia bacterium]